MVLPALMSSLLWVHMTPFYGELMILSIFLASKVLIGIYLLSHKRRGTSAFILPTMGIWKRLNVALVTAFVFLVDFTPGGRENCTVEVGLIESNQNVDCGCFFFCFFFTVTIMQSSWSCAALKRQKWKENIIHVCRSAWTCPSRFPCPCSLSPAPEVRSGETPTSMENR